MKLGVVGEGPYPVGVVGMDPAEEGGEGISSEHGGRQAAERRQVEVGEGRKGIRGRRIGTPGGVEGGVGESVPVEESKDTMMAGGNPSCSTFPGETPSACHRFMMGMDASSWGWIPLHERTLAVGVPSEPFDGDVETGDTCSDDDDIVHSLLCRWVFYKKE